MRLGASFCLSEALLNPMEFSGLFFAFLSEMNCGSIRFFSKKFELALYKRKKM